MAALGTESNARELLQCAKSLKQFEEGAAVHINPHLTPAEAQAEYEPEVGQQSVNHAVLVKLPNTVVRVSVDTV